MILSVMRLRKKAKQYEPQPSLVTVLSFQALKEEDPKAALDSFQRVLDLENGEKGEWGFKVINQIENLLRK